MKLLWTIDTQYDTFCADKYNHIIDNGDTVFIPFCGKEEDEKISISYIQIEKNSGVRVDGKLQKIETFDLPHDISYTKKICRMGNKVIKYKSERYIECQEDEKVIWTFKHWGYLYTDIIEKNGCVIFGTDGMGSRLYCLDAKTGKLRSETKTHYSGFYDYDSFNWYGENLVVYGKGSLAVLNPFSGEIIDEHKIPSKFPYRSFLQVINGYAFACVVTDNNQATILCFQL